MAWLFHVVEAVDGRWVCRRGNYIDHHPTFEAALAHVSELARADPPAEIIVHRLSGDIQRVGSAI